MFSAIRNWNKYTLHKANTVKYFYCIFKVRRWLHKLWYNIRWPNLISSYARKHLNLNYIIKVSRSIGPKNRINCEEKPTVNYQEKDKD